MSGALDLLPSDIYTHLFHSYLDDTTICCLGLTSKSFYALICSIANSYPHQDKMLKGNVEIKFNNDDCFNLYILFRKKMNFFVLCPRSFHHLIVASKAAGSEDPSALCKYARETHDAWMQRSVVIFDYTTKTLTGDDLCSSLQTVKDLTANSNLVEAVFIHPNSKQIPSEKLAPSLVAALSAKKLGLVRKILAHPSLEQIPTEDLPGLLTTAIEANNKTAFLKLLELSKLKRSEANGFVGPLTTAIETKNFEAITMLFAVTNANSMSDIINPLTAAISANNFEAIQILLNLPNATIATDELSYPIIAAIGVGNQKVLKVLLGKVDDLSWHAVSDIITAARKAKDYDLVKKLLPVFLTKAPLNEIHGYQLSSPITGAILANDAESLKRLLALTQISKIPNQFLIEPMIAAIQVKDTALLEKLLASEDAEAMSVSELKEPIVAAMRTDDGSLIEFILSHPVIGKILGSDALGDLRKAIQNKDFETISAILSDPADDVVEYDVSEDGWVTQEDE